MIRATLFLAPPAHWLLGVSKVRFAPFLLGTAIGFVPGIAVLSYLTVFLGESLGEWVGKQPPGFFAAIILAILVAVGIRRWIARRRSAANLVNSQVSDP